MPRKINVINMFKPITLGTLASASTAPSFRRLSRHSSYGDTP